MNKLLEFLKNLKASNSDKKESPLYKFILPVTCLLIGFVLSFFVILPQALEYFKTQSQINETQSRIDALDQKITLLNSIPLQSYQQELEIALQALPTEKDYISVTTILQAIALDSRARLTGVSFLEGTSDGYQVKVEAIGTMATLKAFLDKLDAAPRILKITGVELSPEKGDNFQTLVTLSAPFVTLPNDIGKVEQVVTNISSADIQMLSKLSQNLINLTGAINNTTSSSGTISRPDPFQ